MAEVIFDTAGILARVRLGAARGILAATEEVRNEALRQVLDTPKTGRVYDTRFFTIGRGPTRVVVPYGSRPAHQASGPGEPPASDTGTLVGRIRTDYDADGLRGRVVASALHAAYLEFGTDRMEPRPFMRPALANMRTRVGELVNLAVRNAIGERGA